MDEQELIIDLDELEEVEKLFRSERFNFPVLKVCNGFCYFNKQSAPLLGDAIKWYTSTEYVIGLPGKRDDYNSFALQRKNGKRGLRILSAAFPVQLAKEKKVQPGYYRLLRFRNGFAFKRYAPFDQKNI